MKVKCIRCHKKFDSRSRWDITVCQLCHHRTPTGLEDEWRDYLEAYRNSLRWPQATVGRAIAYASAIYALATHGKAIDFDAIEKKVHKKDSANPPARVGDIEAFGRHGAGVSDESVGMMFIPITGKIASHHDQDDDHPHHGHHKGGPKAWHALYIVFRGSRGAEKGEDNPLGAGWGQTKDGKSINVDWRSNFNNVQVRSPWAVDCKIHRGFLQVYISMREKVHMAVRHAKHHYPDTRIIVCGHSLGAALSVVCAHDLQHAGYRPFCFPFCCPRVGNLDFALDFNTRIAGRAAPLDCEPDRASYYRSFVFVQSDDPVSLGGKHGFLKQMTEEEKQEVADSASLRKQGWFALRRKSDPLTIYYHVGNLIRASYFGEHRFTYMEKVLLGE